MLVSEYIVLFGTSITRNNSVKIKKITLIFNYSIKATTLVIQNVFT